MAKQSTLKKYILILSIAIVLALFIGFGISSVYDEPKYQDFCEEKFIEIETQEECEDIGGQWNAQGPRPVAEPVRKGFCDTHFTCRQEYDDNRNIYNRNVFFIALVFGTIALIVGGLVLTIESVSAGIMAGGVLIIFYGTVRYWSELHDIIRVLFLGVLLAILIWVGYKKFKH